MTIVIFLSAFIFRSFFIIKYKWFGSDTFRNFRHAKEIKSLGKIPNQSPQLIGDINYGFPPLLAYLLSFIDKKYYQKSQYLSPAFDILSAILGYLFIYKITNSLDIAIIASFIYLFSPLLIYQSVSLNTRQPANFFAILSIYFLYQMLNSSDQNILILNFLLSSIMASIVPLLNRVTLQSLYVTILASSIFFKSILPTAVIVVSIIFSIIVTKKYILKCFVEHFRIIKAHFYVPSDSYSPIKLIASILKWFPFIVFFPFLLINSKFTQLEIFLFVWFISILLLSVFWIFGRGWFHITNGILPFTILFGIVLNNYNSYEGYYDIIINVTAVGSIVICLILYFSFHRLPKKIINTFEDYVITDDLMKCFDYIEESLDHNELLFCIPCRGHMVNGAGFFTSCKILDGAGKSPESHEFGVRELYAFNLNNENLIKILRKYNFKYLLLQKRYINNDVSKILSNQKDIKIHIDSGQYILCEIENENKFINSLIGLNDLSKNRYKLMGTWVKNRKYN